ncbi:hypothetical protein QBC33DRAFT_138184 [Phialemonium atrogriseum]|uniref:Uncharacterized protein n=1 Tax=Phialemonium atrogriseum TaxID=1093897 RepID=A0AAJ0FJX4_9PEZI|nr:uncharacterized protein QBC33DRAFT_138184 [Phialemonium atrogriseum]KAK1765808.1 hypothetical protein QBC33DRAFT_138184 [Phialemonium atrogriseum]
MGPRCFRRLQTDRPGNLPCTFQPTLSGFLQSFSLPLFTIFLSTSEFVPLRRSPKIPPHHLAILSRIQPPRQRGYSAEKYHHSATMDNEEQICLARELRDEFQASGTFRSEGPAAGRGRQPRARGGQTTARGGQATARGGQVTARGEQTRIRGGQPAARGTQPTARGGQHAARGTQSRARRGRGQRVSRAATNSSASQSTSVIGTCLFFVSCVSFCLLLSHSSLHLHAVCLRLSKPTPDSE